MQWTKAQCATCREDNIGPLPNIDIFDIEPPNIGIPVLNIALSYNDIGFAAMVA